MIKVKNGGGADGLQTNRFHLNSACLDNPARHRVRAVLAACQDIRGTIPRWSDRPQWTPPLAHPALASGRSLLRAAIAARSRYSICASAKRTPAAAPHPRHSSRSGAASRTPLRADQPTPAHPRAAKRLPLPAWDFGSARYRRTHPESLRLRLRRPAIPRAATQSEKRAASFPRATESAIAAGPGSTPHAPAAKLSSTILLAAFAAPRY